MRLTVAGLVPGERTVIRTRAPTLLVTIEGASARAVMAGETAALDRSNVLLTPKGRSVELNTRTHPGRIAILGIEDACILYTARVFRRLTLDVPLLRTWLTGTHALPRTVWVHELVHRYVFERYALSEHESLASKFLEAELVKELYFLLRDRRAGADRAPGIHSFTPCVVRSIAFIDRHLFEPLDVRILAKAVGASESTLLRSFRRELRTTPAAYWRARRLDEALVLLRAGGVSVADVARRVGYDNPTAFGHAFLSRFGQPPSAFRPKRPTRPAP